MKIGLLGEKLGHSYSPQIHSLLGDYSYELTEVGKEELDAFMRDFPFDAMNVTIPYKKDVIPYMSQLSDRAKKIGSVNTVIKRPDGTLYGDNTDYYGFSYMLRKAGISAKGKKVIIIGAGGASATAQAVVTDEGARESVVISKQTNTPEVLALHADAEILINTTPVGMYPNNGESPVDLDIFPALIGVADVIYNPAETALMLAAEKRGIPCAGGLSMLVAQAKLASEIFTGGSIADTEIERIADILTKQMRNIVLIGMPGCGKTTVGTALSKLTGRRFVDCDEEIVKREGRTIPEIFAEEGEDGFRRIESEVTADIAKESGLIIATGGGVVTRERNYDLLHQNGIIVCLKRNLSELATEGRPLSQSRDLHEMEKERAPMYARFADITVDVHDSTETAKVIMEAVL